MRRFGSVLWGLALVAVGVLIALRAFNVLNFDLFFNGWWTLFIIVPCFISLLTEREKLGSFIGLAVGVVLLLACQGVFSFGLIWKLILPFIAVVVGVKLIFGAVCNKKAYDTEIEVRKENGGNLKRITATFSAQNVDLTGEEFRGVELTSVFGGIKCDLRNAVIKSDSVVNVCAIFGGIDILLPENINVKISSNSIFGGFSDKRVVRRSDADFTVYIKGNCIFGGVDIK